MIPFAALIIAGYADQLVRLRLPRIPARWAQALMAVPLAVGALALAQVWVPRDAAQLTNGSPVATANAVAWIARNVGRDNNMVVDDNVWLDLVRAGYDPTPPRALERRLGVQGGQ